jgi:dihydropteroate synthase
MKKISAKYTAFPKHKSMQIKGRLIDFNKPLTMGILNITSDSFYSDSRVKEEDALLEKAGKMMEEGAEILDIGAYSTRPGADDVPIEDETENLVWAIEKIAREYPNAIISADTFRAFVARAAVQAGAGVINDIGGGNLDADMFATVADLGVPYILMHSRGTPKTMKNLANYEDVVNEVVLDLSKKINELHLLGVADIIVDPGFGFAKTIEHNFGLLRRLDELLILDAPLLVGISRKSMIWKTLGTSPEEALNGTTALNMLALEKGASILRVHDVREAKECVELWERLGGS